MSGVRFLIYHQTIDNIYKLELLINIIYWTSFLLSVIIDLAIQFIKCRREIMKKKLLALFLAFAMVFSLAACGSDEKEENTGKQAENQEVELEDTLVIYTTHSEEMVGVIADAFTEETGVEVEFINLKGELADRVRSEKENPQADIMFGGDAATYMILDEEGCYEATEPTWGAEIDAAYKAENGNWYGTYLTPMVLFYNTNLLTAETAPADWSDLVNAEYANLIVTRDSLSSSMGSTVASLIQYYTETEGETAAWDYIAGLSANTKNYYNSGSMMFQAVGKDEAAISMAVINDVFTNRDENEMPIEIVIPESGAIVITDCVAAIKDAPHPNAAAAFMEFIGSEEAQLLTAKEYNRMPVITSILADCPAWMQTEFSVLDVDWSVISENKTTWLQTWETDYIDANKTVAKE